MRKSLIIFTLLSICFSGLDAQRRGLITNQKYDAGGYLIFSAGPAYCSADTYGPLFDKSFINGNNWCTSVGFKQIFPQNFGYRVNLIYGNYVGDDNHISKLPHTPFYSYSSDIMELTFRAEYSIKFGEKFRLQTPHSVYGYIGIGAVSTNITNPSIANITILKTDTPSSIAGILPVGIGYQYEFDNGFTIGAEAGIQYAFTDELDGYNPPTNSKFNDVLANLSITIGFKIF